MALGILTLPYYLILGDKILDITGKVMFQRWVYHGSHCILCTSYQLICRICKVFQIALTGGERWEILLGEFFYWVVGTFFKVKNNHTNQKRFHSNITRPSELGGGSIFFSKVKTPFFNNHVNIFYFAWHKVKSCFTCIPSKIMIKFACSVMWVIVYHDISWYMYVNSLVVVWSPVEQFHGSS